MIFPCLVCSFSQLFGEEDPDQDVSPDTADPEAAGDAGQAALNSDPPNDQMGGVERTSTRGWAESTDYNAQKLFKKVSGLVCILLLCQFHAHCACCKPVIYCNRCILRRRFDFMSFPVSSPIALDKGYLKVALTKFFW